MNVIQIAMMAKKHWYEADPDFMKKAEQHLDIQQETESAARLTLREMDALMSSGLTESEAWQASRELFVFRDPKEVLEIEV
jgi:hypothetical protein